MGNYELLVSNSAEKALKKLPRSVLPNIAAAIQALAVNPRPFGCRKLAGLEDVYRVRVGTYRIIYEILEDKLIIHILKVGHRKDVYR